MNNSTEEQDYCHPLVPLSSDHFYTVSIVGSLFAATSVIENIYVFYFFLSHVHYRKSYVMYLILLAFCDFTLSLIYFPLILVDKIKEYFVTLTNVADIWLSYFAPLLMLAHVLKSWSAYLILAATIERFVVQKQTSKYRDILKFLQRKRVAIVIAGLVAALILKGPVAVEIEPVRHPDCIPGIHHTHTVGGRKFMENYYYGTIYRFFFRNIFSVFVPFILLAYFNLAIVCDLKKKVHYPSLCTRERRQREIQAATRMTVSVVCIYLGSNLLNVALTAWEHIDIRSLLMDYGAFYAISADLVSLLTIIACTLRLPVYLTYDRVMRQTFLIFKRRNSENAETLYTELITTKNEHEILLKENEDLTTAENDVFL